MSSSQTLYSKLKVLVAKLYKAEKLYCSMRRVQINEPVKPAHKKVHLLNNNLSKINSNEENLPNLSLHTHSKITELNGPTQNLIEHANDLRSNEWYKVHHSFRVKLNNILSSGNASQISSQINDLWLEFLAEFEVAELDLQDCSESAKDSLAKEEYSYLFKLSSELIRRKARLQALKVIHDELNTLVSPSTLKQKSNFSTISEVIENSSISANVIPLRRKVANN